MSPPACHGINIPYQDVHRYIPGLADGIVPSRRYTKSVPQLWPYWVDDIISTQYGHPGVPGNIILTSHDLLLSSQQNVLSVAVMHSHACTMHHSVPQR